MSGIEDILRRIDPAELSFFEWLSVGMALKSEGFPWFVWEDWCLRGGRECREGQCRRYWELFTGSGSPVSAATILLLAEEKAREKEGERKDG